MRLSPQARRLALAVHVIVSVAFPGAVACFLALALIGLARGGPAGAGIYAAMQAITTLVVVPLCLASLATGLLSALGTPWGLLRYWWVLLKLLMTVPSTAILLIHLSPIAALANAAPGADKHGTQVQMVMASAAALAALIFMTVISIYKPRGVTRFGARLPAR